MYVCLSVSYLCMYEHVRNVLYIFFEYAGSQTGRQAATAAAAAAAYDVHRVIHP